MGDMMTELEQLIEDKKRIEKRIRELKNTDIVANDIKFKSESFPNRRLNWKLIIKTRYMNKTSEIDSWRTVISGFDREDVIEEIPNLVADLQTIYKTIREKDKCTDENNQG